MGKLIKNHWARLIVMVASAIQCGAAIEGFFWPKIFWDIFTDKLNGAVTPVPILQIINLILGLTVFAFEWPLPILTALPFHRSIPFRIIMCPTVAVASCLIYQGPDATGYYLIGAIAYFWAYTEGETICPIPWTLPKKAAMSKA
ncbi:hypothetical protein MMC25_004740 [Agyrium rufum]|nr:hypothetical protein [Agyrium rufum]